MGITRILPRTHGMSTSELIRRVCRYNEERLRDEGLLKEKGEGGKKIEGRLDSSIEIVKKG